MFCSPRSSEIRAIAGRLCCWSSCVDQPGAGVCFHGGGRFSASSLASTKHRKASQSAADRSTYCGCLLRVTTRGRRRALANAVPIFRLSVVSGMAGRAASLHRDTVGSVGQLSLMGSWACVCEASLRKLVEGLIAPCCRNEQRTEVPLRHRRGAENPDSWHRSSGQVRRTG